MVQAPRYLLDRQRLGSRRSEFDRQRQPVEGAAQVEHRVGRLVGRVSPALSRGSMGEQRDGVGERKGSELEHCLTVHVQWDLTGAEDS